LSQTFARLFSQAPAIAAQAQRSQALTSEDDRAAVNPQNF
jgi:hypothetical protein